MNWNSLCKVRNVGLLKDLEDLKLNLEIFACCINKEIEELRKIIIIKFSNSILLNLRKRKVRRNSKWGFYKVQRE